MTERPGASDDRILVERIAMGDEAAFAAAYDRYAGQLFGSLVRFLGDREAAAEVVQDAFLALWRRAGQFDSAAGSLLSWLLAIGRNRAIDRFRSDARRAVSRSIPISSLLADDREESGHGGTADDLPRSRIVEADPAVAGGTSVTAPDEPEVVADRRWTQSVVRELVAELPDVERSVVLLAYARGLSQAEIAERLGAPIGTVKSRTRRALARLRGALAEVPGLLDDGDTRRE